jgi:hypothetical protein
MRHRISQSARPARRCTFKIPLSYRIWERKIFAILIAAATVRSATLIFYLPSEDLLIRSVIEAVAEE